MARRGNPTRCRKVQRRSTLWLVADGVYTIAEGNSVCDCRRGYPAAMKLPAPRSEYRLLLDRKLTELALYANQLCPDAEVEADTVPCEDEDGHLDVSPLRAFTKRKRNAPNSPLQNVQRRSLSKRVSIFCARCLIRPRVSSAIDPALLMPCSSPCAPGVLPLSSMSP